MEKKLPVRIMFMKSPPIGEVTFFDVEKVTDLLASGKYTFAGKYMLDEETGVLTLLELSLVPYSSHSELDLRDPANQNGNLKG